MLGGGVYVGSMDREEGLTGWAAAQVTGEIQVQKLALLFWVTSQERGRPRVCDWHMLWLGVSS